jgi:predicted ATP-grasp superfamily ATP-dependent carboligase
MDERDTSVADVLGSCDGIATFSEDMLMATALLARCHGMHWNTTSSISKVMWKIAQRRALKAAGFIRPRFISIDASDRSQASSIDRGRLSLPAILKPDIGTGSLDTNRITHAPDVEMFLAGREGSWIVEEELPGIPMPASWRGDYVSVEVLSMSGNHQVIGVSGRLVPAPPFRERGILVPSLLDTALERKCGHVAAQALDALEFTDGPSHVELKLTESGPAIIEVNGRLGGNVEHAYLRAYGFSITRAALASAGGAVCEFPMRDPRAWVCKVAASAPAYPVAREVAAKLLADLKRLPGVSGCDIGDLSSLAGGRFTATISSPFSIWLEAENPDELGVRIEDIQAKLSCAGLW